VQQQQQKTVWLLMHHQLPCTGEYVQQHYSRHGPQQQVWCGCSVVVTPHSSTLEQLVVDSSVPHWSFLVGLCSLLNAMRRVWQ
jgi:hypothetical protein